MSFTHLHVHSSFSFRDGASDPAELIARCRELGMDALALTDHDGLYGAIRFYKACREAGIKPIVGLEVAETVFNKIKAFAAFGFNKAHAAAFGLIAYQTAYLRAHHPAELLVGILNNMPMGFYSPAVILNEISVRRLH